MFDKQGTRPAHEHPPRSRRPWSTWPEEVLDETGYIVPAPAPAAAAVDDDDVTQLLLAHLDGRPES